MSDMECKRLTCRELMARLQRGVDTLVIAHIHPDADALGSALAMKLMLEAMGGRAMCVCADEIPDRLRFLTQDVRLSSPLQESILPENLPADFSPAQILAVDTASPSQMGRLYDMYQGKIDLMIDHHGKGEMYADGWVCGESAAAGEMVFSLSRELVRAGYLAAIPEGVDGLLYAAISSDTGCFRYSNVTPDTHRCAAELLKSAAAGAFDPADINHRLFEVKSAKLLLAEKLGFDRLHLFADGQIGIVDFPIWLKEQHELTDEHLETLVDIPRSLEGVQVAVAIRQPSHEGVYRASMRSCCALDVSEVCAAFGGGGHVRAAGCTIVCDGGMETVVGMVADAIIKALAKL